MAYGIYQVGCRSLPLYGGGLDVWKQTGSQMFPQLGDLPNSTHLPYQEHDANTVVVPHLEKVAAGIPQTNIARQASWKCDKPYPEPIDLYMSLYIPCLMAVSNDKYMKILYEIY
uniref:Uncharacterized protein n=1 Tax=Oryza meridionalis TaxID=40149 RepID=A0A0E0D354_9ORYZ